MLMLSLAFRFWLIGILVQHLAVTKSGSTVINRPNYPRKIAALVETFWINAAVLGAIIFLTQSGFSPFHAQSHCRMPDPGGYMPLLVGVGKASCCRQTINIFGRVSNFSKNFSIPIFEFFFDFSIWGSDTGIRQCSAGIFCSFRHISTATLSGLAL